jgi:FG-GAP-like repeat/Abnormal spindle-like microcephaly-assoc'd, ASPM-SPD-2-Hydin
MSEGSRFSLFLWVIFTTSLVWAQSIPSIGPLGVTSSATRTLSASLTGSSQSYLFGRADFPVGAGPVSVVAADFNGDGKLDLAIANQADNTVSILLGQVDGTFSVKTDYPVGSVPSWVVQGDFNGDGFIDLAVSNENCSYDQEGDLLCNPGSISILLGNGDGTFQPHVDLPSGTQPLGIAVGDFNGDGKLDLVTANGVGDTVSVFLGNGNGTFAAPVAYATASGPLSLITADFNDDGKLDVAVGTGGTISVLIGNGDGTFQAHRDTNLLSSTSAQGLASGDFNKDGKMDIVVVGTLAGTGGGGATQVFLGNDDGTFSVASGYTVGYGTIQAVDLNGDGKLDLLTQSASAGGAVVLIGNGDGTFQVSPIGYSAGISNIGDGFVVGDFNGDGKLDFVVTNNACIELLATSCPSGTISVMLGFGDGTFVGLRGYTTGQAPQSIASANLNGDGDLDLVTANFGAEGTGQLPSISVLLGNGDGTFQNQLSFAPSQLAWAIIAADVNGDGQMDLAMAESNCFTGVCSPGVASVYLGNGDGTFQAAIDNAVGVLPTAIAAADFNGDSKLDLVVANTDQGAGNTVSVLLGNGDGTFQPHRDYITGSGPQGIIAEDFNGDGRTDLAVAGSNGLDILLGNGDGTFQPYEEYPYPTGRAEALTNMARPDTTSAVASAGIIASGDFNQDGKLDLAVSSTYNQVAIFLGRGDGSFQKPTALTVLNSFVAVGDFDGDGHQDLATGDELLMGNGDGTFQPGIPIGIGGPVVAGDFNGDGLLDLAAGGSLSSGVAVLLDAPFRSVFPSTVAFGAQGVGTTSQPLTITVSNRSLSFSINSVSVTSGFTATSNCNGNLTPGSSCSINVTFAPTTTGNQNGTLTLTDTTPSSPQLIPLTGSGVNGPYLNVAPAAVSFGTVNVGNSSAPITLQVSNVGNADATISGITISGMNGSDFSQSTSCGAALTVAATCTISVTFKPTAIGSRSATLSITDNAPNSPQTVALTGSGAGLGLGIASGSSASATVAAGNPASYTITIGGAGIAGSVTLTCTGAPTGVGCSVPATVTLSATSPSSETVTVTTTSRTLALRPNHSPTSPWLWAMTVVGFVLLPQLQGRGRKIRAQLGILLLLLAALLCSCGGGSGSSGSGGTETNPNGTPAGTYTLTVTGTIGNTSQSLPLTLTVQ